MPITTGITEVAFKNDSLLAGDDVTTDAAIVAAGQNLKRGQLLGRITATGQVTALNPAAADGSQTVYAVLADNINAVTASAAPIYVAGTFKDSGLIGYVAATHKDALRALNIYVKHSVA